MAPLKVFVFTCFLSLLFYIINGVEVSHDGRAIKIDGKRRVLISGSIHYPRSTPGVVQHFKIIFYFSIKLELLIHMIIIY